MTTELLGSLKLYTMRGLLQSVPDVADATWAEEERKLIASELGDARNQAFFQECGGRIDWHEFWSQDADRSDSFLVEPVLVAGRGHAIYAPAKQGKSFITLWMVSALATGRAILGKPESEPVDVLYLDYEMTQEDLQDFLTQFGYSKRDDLSHLHCFQPPMMPPLDTAEGGDAVCRLVEATGAKLVVMDTVSRVIEGDENSADTFRALYRHTCQRLKHMGVAYVRLDHTGKDPSKGQRGSSAKNDDVDLVWSVKRVDNGQQLTATYRRMMWVPHVISLRESESDNGALTFRMVEDTWPAGTAELAQRLDEMGIAIETGRQRVRRMLGDAGVRASNELLAAAIRWRKSRWPSAPPT
jgi:hypothetical protein